MVSNPTASINIFDRPDEWLNRSLGELFIFKNGLNKEKRYFGTGTPIVNYMDVYSFPHIRENFLRGRVTVNQAERENFSARQGDVFFTRTSETVEDIGMASVALDDLKSTVFSGFVLRARPTGKSLNSLFAGYALRSDAVRSQISATASYTTRALTNGRLLSAVRLNVPPIQEQVAIAAVLADTDALIEALEGLISKKRAIMTGAMEELLSGQRRLPGFTEDWSARRLAEFGWTYGGLIGKSKRDFGRGQAHYIPFMSIMKGVNINLEDLPVVDVHPNESQNTVRPGDIFFNGSSETPEEVGMCAVLTETDKHLYLNSFCFGFRFKSESQANALFIAYLFRSRIGRNLLASLAQGATRYNLSKRALMNVYFNCPAKDEQDAIANVLSDMNEEIEALACRLAKTRRIRQGMMQELLTGRVRLL